MHKAGVSLETPPNSAHFDVSKCLKPPKEEHANENIPVAASTSTTKPMEYPYPPPPPWMYHYSPFSIPPMPPPYPYSAVPPSLMHPPLAISNHAVPNSPVPSPATPGKALSFNISLDKFCSHYNIDTSDQQKLESLGYRPGDNNILKLEVEDWKGVQFAKLRWMSFLDTHRRFLRDVKSGLWDHSLKSL